MSTSLNLSSFLVIIILILTTLWSEPGLANAESERALPLDAVRSQIAHHCSLWSREQRHTLSDMVQGVFEETTPVDKAAKIEAFLNFFPEYLTQLPDQITASEFEFILQRTRWFMELFLSNPLPQQESVSQLLTQVESLIFFLQEVDVKRKEFIPQSVRKAASDLFLETVMKVARNPLFPTLKRPLTQKEMSNAEAEIQRRLRYMRSVANAESEQELLKQYANEIAWIVLPLLDGMTKPEPPEMLVRMEQEYLKLSAVRHQLLSAHASFHNLLLSSSIRSLELTEMLLREAFLVHDVTASIQLQLFVGY